MGPSKRFLVAAVKGLILSSGTLWWLGEDKGDTVPLVNKPEGDWKDGDGGGMVFSSTAMLVCWDFLDEGRRLLYGDCGLGVFGDDWSEVRLVRADDWIGWIAMSVDSDWFSFASRICCRLSRDRRPVSLSEPDNDETDSTRFFLVCRIFPPPSGDSRLGDNDLDCRLISPFRLVEFRISRTFVWPEAALEFLGFLGRDDALSLYSSSSSDEYMTSFSWCANDGGAGIRLFWVCRLPTGEAELLILLWLLCVLLVLVPFLVLLSLFFDDGSVCCKDVPEVIPKISLIAFSLTVLTRLIVPLASWWSGLLLSRMALADNVLPLVWVDDVKVSLFIRWLWTRSFASWIALSTAILLDLRLLLLSLFLGDPIGELLRSLSFRIRSVSGFLVREWSYFFVDSGGDLGELGVDGPLSGSCMMFNQSKTGTMKTRGSNQWWKSRFSQTIRWDSWWFFLRISC